VKKILVVEDNENNRYLITFILEKKGHSVIAARTGEEGVELAMKERPDLVLMDIQLPGIDGLETTRRIRASKPGSDVPIIALTSYALVGDREQVLSAGCTGYIEKPINPDTILGEIDKYLAGKGYSLMQSDKEHTP
jgi:two-component system cell cycle response regulator DivK